MKQVVIKYCKDLKKKLSLQRVKSEKIFADAEDLAAEEGREIDPDAECEGEDAWLLEDSIETLQNAINVIKEYGE